MSAIERGSESEEIPAIRAHARDAGLGSLPMTHEKAVEIRWSDVDAYQHVNNAVYAKYLEECRDEWVERALGDAGDAWDLVLARVVIDFRRELLLEDEEVVVSCTARADRQLEPGATRAGADARRRARRRGRGRTRRP
jgi:Thioesterase-like superfamily